jgi:hypothetical protein
MASPSKKKKSSKKKAIPTNKALYARVKAETKRKFSKYSPKQKKLARTAPPRNKITGADFKKLKKKKRKK